MVHILLTILKVLGIALAVLFAALIFLFLIVLFGPIGYEAEGKKDNKIDVKVRVSWLFFVIRGTVLYHENGFRWFVRLFGILAASNEEEFLKKKEEKRKRREAKARQKEIEKIPAKTEEEPLKTDVVPEITKAEKTVEHTVKNEVPPASNADDLQEDDLQTEHSKKGLQDQFLKFKESLKRIRERIRQIPSKIRSFVQRVKEIIETGKNYKEFLFCEANKKVFAFLFQKIKKMAVHILPRKLKGRVEFGVEDPYVMGQILAVLGILFPFYQDRFEVMPDFDEAKLNGEFYLKGRIIPGYLLLQCLIAVLNKEVRRLIRDGRKLIGGNV